MNVLKRKDKEKKRKEGKEVKPERPIRTVYHDLVKTNTFLKRLVVGLGILVIFFVLKGDKDPIVIRETLDSVVFDAKVDTTSKVTAYDVELFIYQFLDHLDYYDSYGIDEVPHALNMMAPELRKKFIQRVFTQEIVDAIKEKKITTTTTFGEVAFKEEGAHIIASVDYKRKLKTFDHEIVQVKDVRVMMVIESLPERTKAYPFGLRVKEYQRKELG